MTITAKFPSKCRDCGQSIQIGQSIDWERGRGSRHAGRCPQVCEEIGCERDHLLDEAASDNIADMLEIFRALSPAHRARALELLAKE